MFFWNLLLKINAIALFLWLNLPVEATQQLQSVRIQKSFSAVNTVIAATENQKRTALIIGNSNYQKTGQLLNPINDATDMANTLKELGFDVIVLKDADRRQMGDALNEFHTKLRQGGVGVFYYAGHGIQVEGENYLVPIDAQLQREEDVVYETLPVGKILGAMENAGNQTNILILDACRDNPFSRRWQRSIVAQGLAPIQAVGGSFIAYATAPGDVAADGDGRNGTFTTHILQNIKTPNLTVEDMFKRVRQGVAKETNNQQIPWDSSSLIDEFYFNFNTSVTTPTPPAETTPTPPPSTSTSKIAYAENISTVRTLTGHLAAIRDVAIAPDGKTIVSGSLDGTIKIWNLVDGKLVRTLPGHRDWVFSIALSPDGKTIASSSRDGTIKIWNLADGKLLRTISAPRPIYTIAIAPDGKTLAGGDIRDTVSIWNMTNGESIRSWTNDSAWVLSIAIAPDGQTLASGNGDGTVKIWNFNSGKLLRTFNGHSDRVDSIAISLDGKTLVSGSRDRTIKVWNLSNGKLLHDLIGHTDVVTSVAISFDGETIVSGSHDGTIDIWSLSDGELLHTLGDRPGWMISVAITPDNHKIVSSFFVPSTETKQATVQEILIWQASP
jgi:hypothetical protein